ncbi:hypothetical protein [Terrabacter carboxydivorans]|uniref:Uncharacterized protein n=1 Tax=Terrabacter carboxydivorans TaxID=619730 RepID=A0ABP5XY50_9MICO
MLECVVVIGDQPSSPTASARWARNTVRRTVPTAAELLERARANPGKEEFETWDDGGKQVLCIDVLVEGDEYMEEGWVSMTLPDGEFLTDDQFYDVALRLVPQNVEPLWTRKFRDRECRRGEVVFTWTLDRDSE